MAQGLKQIYIWISEDHIKRLKEKYPGPRGGINWTAVIEAALGIPSRDEGK
jgi:hypothetical protein